MFTLRKRPGRRADGRIVAGLNGKGFSLFELLVVLGIAAVLAAVTVPSILNNVPRFKLKSAARTLVTDFQKAKMEAVKRNCTVEIRFSPGAYDAAGKIGSYQIVEVKAGVDTVLLSRQMPEYVSLYATGFTGDKTGYTAQGLPSSAAGSVFMRNNKSTYYQLALSAAGHVSLSMSSDGITWN